MSGAGILFSLSVEQYVNLKRMAYDFYEDYMTKDEENKALFIKNLEGIFPPGSAENAVIRTTLLIPDTHNMDSKDYPHMYKWLQDEYGNTPTVTKEDLAFKVLEYQKYSTPKLIQNGVLRFMDSSYFSLGRIDPGKYYELKNDALARYEKFSKLSLAEKSRLLTLFNFRKERTPYELSELPGVKEHYDEFMSHTPRMRLSDVYYCAGDKEVAYNAENLIFLSTLFIPDDVEFYDDYLKANGDINKLVSQYRLPSSVIRFKLDEYDKQETLDCIDNGTITMVTHGGPYWYSQSELPKYGYSERFDSVNRMLDESYFTTISISLDRIFDSEQLKRGRTKKK